MALPLKSGADLYNNQALRLRLHNLGADPTEVGAGLIYFNTSTGLNTSQKARLYTGSAWKTIAFSEDLDVASNADFLALKERVDLLSGDVDTDAIISNMKEVSAFLEGFAEDAKLMTVLNGKLDKTGGTLIGSLTLGNTQARLKINGSIIEFNDEKGEFKSYLGVYKDNLSVFKNSRWNPLLHEGNYSDYALPLTGGTIDGDIKINSIDGTPALIYFSVANSGRGALGCVAAGPVYYDVSNNGHDILHSGNVGNYALKYYANQGAIDFNDVLYNGIQYVSSSSSNAPITRVLVSFGHGDSAWQIAGGRTDNQLRYRASNGTSDSWSDWKTIAFTDSNVASAQALAHSNGTVGATVDASGNVSFNGAGVIQIDGKEVIGKHSSFYIGYQTAVKDGLATRIWGKGFQFSNEAGAHRMLINESGNVTIGDQDYASNHYKLYVTGSLYASDLANLTNLDVRNISDANYLFGIRMNTDGVYLQSRKEGVGYLNTILNYNGGNVLIGTTTDNGAKLQVSGRVSIFDKDKDTSLLMQASQSGVMQILSLDVAQSQYNAMSFGYQHQLYLNSASSANRYVGINTNNPQYQLDVNGDLHVKGNIIADGEVSAGGRAEEGGNAGGGGAFHSESIAVGATQTTIAHGLGTDDIVVSIYEKDGVSGRWSIILTDVEIVDANNIIVSFGSATSVEHKVVIMGAVA